MVGFFSDRKVLAYGHLPGGTACFIFQLLASDPIDPSQQLSSNRTFPCLLRAQARQA